MVKNGSFLCHLLNVGFLLPLFFDFEDGSEMFLRKSLGSYHKKATLCDIIMCVKAKSIRIDCCRRLVAVCCNVGVTSGTEVHNMHACNSIRRVYEQ